ncbi:MAG: hypothetical protein A2071_09045 [Bacteroidetes bacterium GWC1_47_7]|uniref:DUF7668 domain-containing protein n=1 Tax=Candidatus Woesebacteria bacterium GW2011_GWA1_41_13b TaxID=1618555 RepID=A0A0G0X4V0_9BACT|nr:MAG: hypothetical protein UU42_C0008G0016 [Candidatus Woesebacteria bacterium GW2011_GWA1_41_13b]KKT74189.1 MAG: hypothetical protein UW69_C0045G0016 [Microgenomates group bacterium GW2011_GWA2_44_7]OFX75703.1 MAG: hypothetical protein A2071_09045 [Bacteroidetes bacterium GWC1_47_7]
MDNQTFEQIKKATREVEIALVNGDYISVDSSARKSRLTGEEIKNAIDKYGGKLSLSPESTYNNIYTIEIENSNPKAWAVDLDLWTNGKLSDLTAQLTVVAEERGFIGLIDDIHVL